MYESAQEIFGYLPIRRNNLENDYIEHLWNAFLVLDESNTSARSFNLMPFHLLFMMAVQYKALRIYKEMPEKYALAMITKNPRDGEQDILAPESPLAIAFLGESEIIDLLKITGLPSADARNIKKTIIRYRNDKIAHAKGYIEQEVDRRIAVYIEALHNIRSNFSFMNQQIAENLLGDLTGEDDVTQILESLLSNHSLDENDLVEVAKILLESKKPTPEHWMHLAEYLLAQFDFDPEIIKTAFPKKFNTKKETYSDDSLFCDELLSVSTNRMLDIVKANYPAIDPYYLASACIEERKRKFDTLWRNFKPYADRHFRSQAKTSFHQRSWEMYIANVLLEKGLNIESNNEGPDFVVNKQLYIECIAPTKGEPGKPDSVPSMYVATKPSEIMVQDVPVDKMILRITQALKDKALDQYEKWKSKPWFDENKPFVVAINTGDLEYPQDYLGIPLVVKALLGLQYMQISQNGAQGFSWRNEIAKGAGVPVNYFANDSFSFVSGVIFSDKTVLSHPEVIGDDCIFVNNPWATHPTDDSFNKLFKNWEVSKEKDGMRLVKNYK